ncbi:MAG: hypothetical protein R3B06_25065 [Kofleriaceae bacterium]
METEPLIPLAIAMAFLAACGGDDGTAATIDAAPGTDAAQVAQTPPSGAANVDAWIAAGHYLSWNCEAAPHDARAPSPHGRNRICNNDALHGSTAGPFPIGAASVKELRDPADAIIGYAVYRKDADGTDGSNWYWYEVADGTVVADGTGGSGPPNTICVDCHSHAPRDFVFTIAP